MKNLIPILLVVFWVSVIDAQVGVNNTAPAAEVDITMGSGNIPALALEPQAVPTGTATGQIAVIGDLLYMYDATRSKWLSIESSAFQYGRNGNRDNQRLDYGGSVRNNDSGPLMPRAGTIVAMTINSDGSLNKEFRIRINGSNVPNNADPTLDGQIELTSGSFLRTDYNIDFAAGDVLTIHIQNDGLGNIDSPAAVLWVKWRQDNP